MASAPAQAVQSAKPIAIGNTLFLITDFQPKDEETRTLRFRFPHIRAAASNVAYANDLLPKETVNARLNPYEMLQALGWPPLVLLNINRDDLRQWLATHIATLKAEGCRFITFANGSKRAVPWAEDLKPDAMYKRREINTVPAFTNRDCSVVMFTPLRRPKRWYITLGKAILNFLCGKRQETSN